MSTIKSSGLGRGLGSLIPTKRPPVTPAAPPVAVVSGGEQVREIAPDKIQPNPHQPRHMFDDEHLADLRDSIKEHGIIQPLIVTEAGDGRYQLIAGERRWRSAQQLGLATVPVIVRDLSEQKKMEIALIENLQRMNLNAIEVARAYQKLMDEFNLTQEQLAKRVGKSRPAVANSLRLLGAAPEVQEAVERGEISEGHARVIVGLPMEDQLPMLAKIKQSQLNVRDTEKAGKEIVVQKHVRKVNVDVEMRAREERLQAMLGTKVEIKKSGTGGQVIISYFAPEELEALIDRLAL